MKKILSLSVLFLLIKVSFAQTSVANQTQIKDFYNTKTCVVLETGLVTEFNAYIQEAMEKFWTVTDYEIISYSEFESRRKDASYSFILKTKIEFEGDNTGAEYDFLTLILGGRYAEFADMPELANFPLSYYRIDEEKYIYKLGTIIAFLQNHVEITKNNPQLNSNNIIDFYNKNVESMVGKTLYIIKEDLDPEVDTPSEIKEVYPGNVKFVSREDMEELINSGDPNGVFLHKVGPGTNGTRARCWKLILGISDAKLYYFDFHMINARNPDGFKKSDFKAIKRS